MRLTTDDHTHTRTTDHGTREVAAVPVFGIGLEFEHEQPRRWYGVYFSANDSRERAAERLELLARQIREDAGAKGEEVRSLAAVCYDEFKDLLKRPR